MNISKFKLVIKFLFGGGEAALDYVLDCANTLAAKLPDAKKDEIKGYLAIAEKTLETLDAVSWLCPARWQKAYWATTQAFANLVSALDDLTLTADEITHVANAFQLAYAAWRAE